MNMVLKIYKNAWEVLKKKPLKLWGISLMCILLAFVGSVLGGPVIGIGLAVAVLLETSMAMIFLKGYVGEDVCLDELFDCFRDWNTVKRVLGGMGWMILWVFIWGLIPVVGWVFAIIRIYEYRLTPYILMKEPEVGIRDAIKVSKERTEGYKGKMFLADILWVVAYFIAFLILSGLSSIRYIGWIFLIVNIVLVVAVCLLAELFRGLISSAFYVEIEKKRLGSPYYEAPQTAVQTEIKTCPSCGVAVTDRDVFCSSCGYKLKDAPVYEAAEKVKKAAKKAAEEISEDVTKAAEKASEGIADAKEAAQDIIVETVQKKKKSTRKTPEKKTDETEAPELSAEDNKSEQ